MLPYTRLAPAARGGRGKAAPSRSLAFRRQAANKAGKQGSGIISPSVPSKAAQESPSSLHAGHGCFGAPMTPCPLSAGAREDEEVGKKIKNKKKIAFAFPSRQLHPLGGKAVEGRMNPRFKERFPSAVPRLVALQQDDVQLAAGWAGSPRAGAVPCLLPGGLGGACRGRGGVGEDILHIFRKEAWDPVSHSRK